MGYDAGKLVKGRKLHLLVDTLGLPIALLVHSAGVQDRDGAIRLFAAFGARLPALDVVYADAGYDAGKTRSALRDAGAELTIVRRRLPRGSAFEVLPKRWVVERTFAWIGRNRRLAKTWDALVSTMTAFATLAAIQLGIRRLARNHAF
jgi:transposase